MALIWSRQFLLCRRTHNMNKGHRSCFTRCVNRWCYLNYLHILWACMIACRQLLGGGAEGERVWKDQMIVCILNLVSRDQHRSYVGKIRRVAARPSICHTRLISPFAPTHLLTFLFIRLKRPIVPCKLQNWSMTTILGKQSLQSIVLFLGWSHKIFSTISTTNKFKLHTTTNYSSLRSLHQKKQV